MSEQSTKKPEILVIDDSKVVRIAASKMLGSDYEIHLAEDGLAGWQLLQENNNISVVFSDLIMPKLSGMELLEKIRHSSDGRIANLPVIIMTGHDDSESGKQAVFDVGATDFISKPFEPIDLVSRAKSYVRLSRQVVELEKKTGYDKLTGLYNAKLLEEQGIKAFSFAGRHKLFISMACFEIRDLQNIFLDHGKNVAQHVIAAVAKRIQNAMREEDIAARLAVAKYTLILPMTNKRQAEIVTRHICERINKLVFDTGKEKIRVNLVAGYKSLKVTSDIGFAKILEQTDDALQTALNSPTQPIVYADDENEVDVPEFVVTETDIEQAFKHIFEGDFYKIPEVHFAVFVEHFSSFIQYAQGREKLEQSIDSTKKNVAL